MSFLKKSFKRLRRGVVKNRKAILGVAAIGAGVYFAPAIAGALGGAVKKVSGYGATIKQSYNTGIGAGVPSVANQMYKTILKPQSGRAASEPISFGNQASLMYGAETENGVGPARTVAAASLAGAPMSCAATGGTPEFVITAFLIAGALIAGIALFKTLRYKKRKVKNVGLFGYTR